MDTTRTEPFPLEELMREAPAAAREAYVERSAAFEAGDLVRMMREKARLTQKELAKKISTSQSHLSEVERGNGLQGPTFSMLRKVANACELTLRIEIAPEAVGFYEMSSEQRRAIAEGLEVSEERVDRALLGARDRALAILSLAFIEQIVKADTQAGDALRYARWLHGATEF